MSDFPTGTVTFLFSDIEGSTQLLHRLGEGYSDVLVAHRQLMRAAFEAHGGREVDTQGDAFFVAFATAGDAVAAAVAAQRALAAHSWPDGGVVQVRLGLHTGEPVRTQSGYVGLDVHHGARVMAAGHGGQTLLSAATRNLTLRHLPTGVSLRDLGEYRLKDMAHAEMIYQLVIPGLPNDFPPLKTLGNRSHNLPGQMTALVGRAREVAAVEEMLQRSEVRLLTLTGPGGTGKTRLALQVAANLLGECDDGVFHVALAPISDPSLVASTIAHTLDIKEVVGQAPLAALKEALHDKSMLLVLDNFEQVVGAAPLVAELLQLPALKILVTSRIALHISGEHEFPVPPLALPRRKPPPPIETMSQYAAVQLFIERAQAVKPDFAFTNENVPAIAEICFHLDGLPLAIELAAARVKLLPPQAMLARMTGATGSSSLKVLTGGARDLPARQQTLRAVIGWSYDLLQPSEQVLFRRLAVFVGGCTLDAIEAVCHADDLSTIDETDFDVLDAVSSLMDKSLLWQQESEGEPRFFMLQTIHEFALERLQASGEEDALRNSHARYFLALVEAAYPKLLGSPEQAAWMEQLESKNDNLRAALSWLVEHQPAAGLRMAVAVARFWRTLGHDSELHETLQLALQRGQEAPVEVRVVALREAGEVMQRMNFYERGRELLEESVRLCRESGDIKNLAHGLRPLGEGARAQNDLTQAQLFFDESLAIERARGDKAAIGAALHYFGSLARDRADLETAHSLFEESAGLFRQINDERGLAYSLTHLAAVAYLQDDFSQARSHYERALPIFRKIRERSGLLWALRFLSEIANRHRDYEAARVLFEERLLVDQDLGAGEGIVRSLCGLADVARDEGRHEEARALLRQVIAMLKALDEQVSLREPLEGCIQSAVAEGHWERAARLIGALPAAADHESATSTAERRQAHQKNEQATRTALGTPAFDALVAQSRALTREQTLSYVLEDAADAASPS